MKYLFEMLCLPGVRMEFRPIVSISRSIIGGFTHFFPRIGMILIRVVDVEGSFLYFIQGGKDDDG